MKYIVASFFALILALTFSNNVNAASEYDNTIRTTNKLTLGYQLNSGQYEKIDITGLGYKPIANFIDGESNFPIPSNGTVYNTYYPDYGFRIAPVTDQVNYYKGFLASANQGFALNYDNPDSNYSAYQYYYAQEAGTVTFDTRTVSGNSYRGLNLQGTWMRVRCFGSMVRTDYGTDCSIAQISNYERFIILESVGNVNPAYEFMKIYFSENLNIFYPEGYEGKDIHNFDPLNKTELKPNIQYRVSETGLLTVEYMKNISPFLTGIFYVNVDTLGNNWSPPVNTIHQITAIPAGWLNDTYQLPSSGYYMLNVSHNQQLDSPPWTNPETYNIPQVYMQFYWDGKTAITGSNVGCSATEMCNPFLEEKPGIFTLFETLNIPIYGLQIAILKPLDFLAQLNSQNCSPLVIPTPIMLGNKNIVIPCMMTVYSTYFNDILVLYQVILTALFSYYISRRALETVKQLSNPRDDQIETVAL